MDANTKQPTAMESGYTPAASPAQPDPASLKPETKGGSSGSGKQKQQVIVFAILVLLLGSVGIWQYQSNSSSGKQTLPAGAPSGEAKRETNSGEPKRLTGSPFVQLASLTRRDPFMPDKQMMRLPSDPSSPNYRASAVPMNRAISGSPPPLPPMPFPQGGRLEPSYEPNRPDPGLAQSAPEAPQWEVVGVVEGPNTVAIVKDAQGNRRFVRDGDSLGDGYKVQLVRRGEVIMRGHGQNHTLKVGQSTFSESQKSAQQLEGGSPQ